MRSAWWSAVKMGGPLDHPASGSFDRAVLPGLLARLGPAVAAALRRQFELDLRGLRTSLDAALAPPGNAEAIARQAHVLVALAGTAGADGVAEKARGVIELIRTGDVSGAARRVAALAPLVDALADFVAACPLPRPPSYS